MTPTRVGERILVLAAVGKECRNSPVNHAVAHHIAAACRIDDVRPHLHDLEDEGLVVFVTGLGWKLTNDGYFEWAVSSP